jgi:glycosyltransferase involved in cell wall biosynthesis
MRVLLTNHVPLHGSATGTYTYDLAVGLLQAGHEVRVLVLDEEAGRAGRETGEGAAGDDEPFTVRRVVCKAGDAAADLPFAFPCFTAHPRSSQSFYALSDEQIARYRDVLRRCLDEEISAFDPQVVHTQHIWLLGHLALEAGVPYVLSATGSDLLAYAADERYRRFAEEAAENAGRILASSDYTRRQVLATFDVPDERVETIYPAIDLGRFASLPPRAEWLTKWLPQKPSPIITFVGKLTPDEGVDTLLNAAAIYENHPKLQPTTLIFGDGPQRGELEAQARRLGLKRVHFLGDRPRIYRANVCDSASLVVVPSRGGTISPAVFESMAVGTPVLGTSIGGLPEVLSDKTGGLVPVDDHELLAEAITKAVDENWKRAKGPTARAYVRDHHSLERAVPEIVSRYERVIADRGVR